MTFLILVSPRIANSKVKMTSIPSAETAGVEDSVSRSVNERSRKVQEQEEASWFWKMFTW